MRCDREREKRLTAHTHTRRGKNFVDVVFVGGGEREIYLLLPRTQYFKSIDPFTRPEPKNESLWEFLVMPEERDTTQKMCNPKHLRIVVRGEWEKEDQK